MSKEHMPYYFEVPELPMPPFDLEPFLIPEDVRESTALELKSPEVALGKTRTNLANWYHSFIPYEGSKFSKRDPSAVGMYEEANLDLSKLLKEWLHDTLNVKFTHVVMLRTPAGLSGRWHTEGPTYHDRRCGLNFPMSGDFVNSKAQWATFPRFKDVDPVEYDRMRHVSRDELPDAEILSEWTNQTVPGFQNTLHMHRGYNEESDIDRVILTASVEDVCDINVMHRKYMAGKLFK